MLPWIKFSFIVNIYSTFQDLDKVQELLLGNTSKKKEEKYVPQGLFQDRKHNNFFNVSL